MYSSNKEGDNIIDKNNFPKKDSLLNQDVKKKLNYEKSLQQPPTTKKTKRATTEKIAASIMFIIILSNLIYAAVTFISR